MTEKDYFELALSTEKKFPAGLTLTAGQARLLHAAMGLATEAGEFLDMVKKNLIYEKPVDRPNGIEEVGDLFWYLVLACTELGCTFGQAQEINIEKLSLRYKGAAFDPVNACLRRLNEERLLLVAQTSGIQKTT